MELLLRREGQDLARVDKTLFRLTHNQGHLYIPLSKKSSLDSVVSRHEPMHAPDINQVMLAKGHVLTPGKEPQEIKRMHKNLAHASYNKMKVMLNEAGQWNGVIKEITREVLNNCTVRRCRESKQMAKKDPNMAIRVVRELGNLVFVDLKI